MKSFRHLYWVFGISFFFCAFYYFSVWFAHGLGRALGASESHGLHYYLVPFPIRISVEETTTFSFMFFYLILSILCFILAFRFRAGEKHVTIGTFLVIIGVIFIFFGPYEWIQSIFGWQNERLGELSLIITVDSYLFVAILLLLYWEYREQKIIRKTYLLPILGLLVLLFCDLGIGKEIYIAREINQRFEEMKKIAVHHMKQKYGVDFELDGVHTGDETTLYSYVTGYPKGKVDIHATVYFQTNPLKVDRDTYQEALKEWKNRHPYVEKINQLNQKFTPLLVSKGYESLGSQGAFFKEDTCNYPCISLNVHVPKEEIPQLKKRMKELIHLFQEQQERIDHIYIRSFDKATPQQSQTIGLCTSSPKHVELFFKQDSITYLRCDAILE